MIEDYRLHYYVFDFAHDGTFHLLYGIVRHTAEYRCSGDNSDERADKQRFFHISSSCSYCVRDAWRYACQFLAIGKCFELNLHQLSLQKIKSLDRIQSLFYH